MPSIGRRRGRTLAEREEGVRCRRPVVFTEAEIWTAEALRGRLEKHAASPALAARLRDGRLRVSEREGVQTETVALREALDAVAAAQRYLVTPLSGALASVVDSEELTAVAGRHRFVSARLWIGPPGVRTPLHQDLPHNLLVQVAGTKRFWLVPPNASRHLGRFSLGSRALNFARLDLERADSTRDATVRALRVDLRPGEILFIPSRWWHQVRSIDACTSISVWFGDGPLALLCRAAQRYAELRGARPGARQLRKPSHAHHR